MSQISPKILSFIDWYEPAFKAGGPVRSMVNLVELIQGKAEFNILCGDKEIDGGDLNVVNSKWLEGKNGEKVFYSPKANLKDIKSFVKENPETVIHINGIYSLKFSILPLFFAKYFFPKQKVVVSPRGMLNPGALKIKSHKKKLFLRMAKKFDLFKKVHWHATSEEEKQRIEEVFPGKNTIHIISNVPIKPRMPELREEKQSGVLKMYSSTRLVPIKKLETILLALKKYPCEGSFTFDIFGPIEDLKYKQELEALAKQISEFELSFKGAVNPNELQQITTQYHLFCLPSSNENFGHSIYESFANACPVLISDRTPWINLASEKAGYDISLENLEAFAKALQHFVSMNQNEWQFWSEAAYKFAERNYMSEFWSGAYLKLFKNE